MPPYWFGKFSGENSRTDVRWDLTFGLAPSPYDSGGSRRDQGISKAGNPRARTAVIEMAWLWLRHQPDSALTQWYNTRVGSFTGRIRRIAIIGLARKPAIALWRYLETGLIPTGVVFSQ